MEIEILGGGKEVGRSCIVIDDFLVLDCGIKLGEKVEFPNATHEEFKGKIFLITHAHLDHSGFLPHLFTTVESKIYTTKPTRDLFQVLFADYRRLQKEKEFDVKHIEKVMRNVKVVDYYQEINFENYKIKFLPAGHILGAAMILIEKGGEKLLYTGDISVRKTKIAKRIEMNVKAETVICESTYADTILPGEKEAYREIVETIKNTADRGGITIFPMFSIGKAQEFLLMLDDFIRTRRLPKLPIYVDGMIKKALRIYRQNLWYANESIKKLILTTTYDPFHSENFESVKRKDRKGIKRPSIVVTSSGMLSGGPILSYLKNYGGEKENTLVITGYQAKNTLGRKILDGERKIKIDEREITLNLEVKHVRLSSHADRNEIILFLNSVKEMKNLVLVHGENPEALLDKFPYALIPENKNTINV